MLAFHQTTRNGKVIESAVLLAFFKCRGNRYDPIRLNTRVQKLSIKMDLGKGNFINRSIGFV